MRALQLARTLPMVVTFAISLSGAASAQFKSARSGDYLFVTNVSDARAAWVNPAGTVVLPEASLMAETVLERPADGSIRVDQWTLGFNSRGFSFGYQRNRFENGTSNNVLRLGVGLPFPRGAIGIAASLYGLEGPNDRDFDIGVMFGPATTVTFGAAVKHIGRASFTGVTLPISLVGGAQWSGVGGSLLLAGETHAVERLGAASGFDVSYRGGAYVFLGLEVPVSFLGAVDVASNFKIDRAHFGVAIGGRSNLSAVATTVSRAGTTQLDRVSLTGIVSNLVSGQR